MTNPEPQPTPTPTPEPSGFSRLDVFNCNNEQAPVSLWTLNAQNLWTSHGTAPSMWSGTSCPGTSAPKKVPLPDNQWVWFVAVDPTLPGCNAQNDPSNVFCQKAKLQVFGKASGLAFIYTIN